MRNITEIIVHCTATPAGREVSVDEIARCHRRRGFSTIGYHYVVGLGGCISAGRREPTVGAHCAGHNRNSIGVCYVGGLDSNGEPADTRTPEQKRALVGLLRELLGRYPGAAIRGHRDFAAKACPCFDATAEYSGLTASL